jgi:hypothetical protein
LAVWLIGFGGFTLLVDPYDILPWMSVDGVNSRKTRAHEDGYRVRVGHHLMTTEAGTIIMGSSRVADGFPRDLPDWEGGWENLGMAGTSAFELARASTLAAENDNVNCVIIGLDLREFGTEPNTQATYWITPLAGGGRVAALLKMALSPHAFARALQTYIDNATGSSDVKWENAYREDGLRVRFEDEITKRYRGYASYEYDPERVAFLFRGIDALLAAGKQVVLFVHPIHVWQEEALHRAGAAQHDIALRRDLVTQLSARDGMGGPQRNCFDGPALQAWDFSGFSDVALTAPPAADGLTPNPWYYVPAHYRPTLGAAVLARMSGQGGAHPVGPEFGQRLNASTLDSVLEQASSRRAEWLDSGEEWQVYVTQAFDTLDANPPEPEPAPTIYLTETERRALERDVSRIERANAPPG